jgi:hypothetical protein
MVINKRPGMPVRKQEEVQKPVDDAPSVFIRYVDIDEWHSIPLGTERVIDGYPAILDTLEVQYQSNLVVEKWRVKNDTRN